MVELPAPLAVHHASLFNALVSSLHITKLGEDPGAEQADHDQSADRVKAERNSRKIRTHTGRIRGGDGFLLHEELRVEYRPGGERKQYAYRSSRGVQ